MTNLKTNVGLVKAILEEDKKARNSDSYLYLKVLNHIALQKGMDVSGMTVSGFLMNMSDLGFPGFESIRRTRQKVQERFPELAADKRVRKYRLENEEEYRAFAKERI